MAPSAGAESLLDEAVFKFEEIRLRQLQTVQNNADISPFTTDGCSGLQSESWKLLAKSLPEFKKIFGGKPPWEDCCIEHDKVYWRGSTMDGYTKRQQADKELKQCILSTGAKLTPRLSVKHSVSEENFRHAFLLTARLMYKTVRLGGLPCSLLPWRWGYGWPNCAFADVSDIPE